jgi:hypothetical protein
MAYQRGSLKQVERKGGSTWVLRRRITKPDGHRVEGTPLFVGLVSEFPMQADAEKEVDRLGLRARINVDQPQAGPLKFDALAEFYLTVEFDPELTASPSSENTKPILQHNVHDYIVAQWGSRNAEEMKTLEIQKWLISLTNPDYSRNDVKSGRAGEFLSVASQSR